MNETICNNMNSTLHNDNLQSEADESSTNQFVFEDTNANPYKDTTYVKSKFNINFLRNSNILIGVVIIITILSIIFCGLMIRGTGNANENNEKHLNTLHSLVISSGKNLWLFDVDSKKQRILQTAKDEITALDTYMEKAVFWRENNTSTINCFIKKYSNVTHTKKWKPQAIAVDYITEKLYLIDKALGTLNVIDMNSNYYGIMISDLDDPHDLVLDPAEGLMFIVEFENSIIRANMDGTSVKKIVEEPLISAIAIDRKATRIYWSINMVSIESSDYQGTNRVTVTKIPMGIASMTVFENQLFWTRSKSWNDICPCTNVLWSCSMYRRNCKNITSYSLSFDNPKIVRTSFDQHRHLIKNPCEKENGGCEHLCLLTSKGSHDCACKTGWILNSDGKTCRNVTDMMLYVQGNFVKAKIFDVNKEAFTDAIIPTEFKVESLRKTLIHFDFDIVSGDFFFSDDHSIYKINVYKDDEQVRIFNVSKDYTIRDLAYDWYKGNLYYVKGSQDPANNHSIIMFSVKSNNKFHKTILTFKYKKEHYIDCPFFLIIHPIHEYLFYSEYNGISDNIRRVSTSGRGLTTFKPLYDFMYNLLSIDLEKSRLYWTTSADPQLILSVNLDSSEDKMMTVKIMQKPMFVGVQGEWLYIGNYTEIWRVHNETAGNAIKIVKLKSKGDTPQYIHGLKIFSIAARNAN